MASSALLGGADVLLVEDDPGDVLLTREAFEDHHLGLQLHVVGDGEMAMRFLRRTWHVCGTPADQACVAGSRLGSGEPMCTTLPSGSVSLASRMPHGQSSAAAAGGRLLSTSSTYR
jgi:hypothetical protein